MGSKSRTNNRESSSHSRWNSTAWYILVLVLVHKLLRTALLRFAFTTTYILGNFKFNGNWLLMRSRLSIKNYLPSSLLYWNTWWRRLRPQSAIANYWGQPLLPLIALIRSGLHDALAMVWVENQIMREFHFRHFWCLTKCTVLSYRIYWIREIVKQSYVRCF